MVAQHGAMAAGRVDIAQLVLAAAERGDDPPVTLVPPLGERDPSRPLRGRDELIETLLPLCLGRGDGLLHVLHGMSGCGKTAIALELVSRLKSRAAGESPVGGDSPAAGDSSAGGQSPADGKSPRRVWWVDARHADTLTAGMRAVARHMGLGTDEVRDPVAVDALWERLDRAPHDWLLVVDNAEDLSLLDGPGRLVAGTGWLRPHTCPRGLVVVTTRHGMARLWGPSAVLHAVGPVAPDHAARILLDRTGDRAGSPAEARALAGRLGGLPLALTVAGSYLAEVNGMPAVFRDANTPADFASYRRALDGDGAGINPARAAAGAWRMSVNLLHHIGLVYAGRVLNTLATFADAPIPYTLVLRPSALSTTVPAFAGLDGTTLWRTLGELIALGLVNVPEESVACEGLPCVRLHPLIRDIARAGTEDGTAVVLMEQALHLDEVRVPPEDPRSWPTWRALAPHALDLLRHAGAGGLELDEGQQTVCANAAELAARYLQSQGLFGQARREFERVLAVRVELLGTDHPETISTMHNLATALHDIGDWSGAEDLYRRVWEFWRGVRGETHPHTLTARHELGRLLLDEGRTAEAQEHLSAVYEAHGAGAEEDPGALATRHVLARVLQERGELDRARQEYEALTAINLRLLGEADPKTVQARQNHACVLYELGRMAEALPECQDVLEARRALYGASHPLTLGTAHLLALVLYALDRVDEAVSLMRDARDRSHQLLGAGHPESLSHVRTLERWSREEGHQV
ncbi:tetratricopeptide repeat protein [Streptomyces sp. NPDC093109]|uniref:tetratricopeptide repeat protein n=1 Tax=Streptomyces sp. NPDC093109 TaxID=3154977 RepID=UPI00344BEF79